MHVSQHMKCVISPRTHRKGMFGTARMEVSLQPPFPASPVKRSVQGVEIRITQLLAKKPDECRKSDILYLPIRCHKVEPNVAGTLCMP